VGAGQLIDRRQQLARLFFYLIERLGLRLGRLRLALLRRQALDGEAGLLRELAELLAQLDQSAGGAPGLKGRE